jgi:hypothetical protein
MKMLALHSHSTFLASLAARGGLWHPASKSTEQPWRLASSGIPLDIGKLDERNMAAQVTAEVCPL